MRSNKALTAVAMLLTFTVAGSTATAKEQGRTVSASVTGGSGGGVGIRAQQQPGFFTVPDGHVATGFKYHFNDPSGNYTSTRLGPSNIYSVTLGREIREAEGNPNIALPAGKYKFIVGGRPGAYGSLSFKVISTTDDPPSDRPPANNRRLPRNFDVAYNPMTDVYCTSDEGRKRLGDFENIDVWNWPARIVVQFRDGQASSQYEMSTSGDSYQFTSRNTLSGTLSNGRFSGTTTDTTHSRITLNTGQLLKHNNGSVHALSGQLDPNGLLVIHGKWQSDHGQMENFVLDSRGGTVSAGNGRVQTRREAYESHPNSRSYTFELHLRMPVGQSQSSQTFVRDRERSSPPPSPGPAQTPMPNGSDVADAPGANLGGNDDNTVWDNTSEPPAGRDEPNQPDDNSIWTNEDPSDDQLADDHTDNTNEGTDNAPDDEDRDTPRPGDRLADGKILFKPPWDEGDAYPMDEEEVKAIKKKQSEGFRWDKRHGWVDDDRQKDIDDIADIQRRSDDKEKKRSDDIADKLKASEKRERQHAANAKRAGDEALAEKVKAQGWNSLTPDERERLSDVDEDIKDGLRGNPKTVRGYKRGIIDKTLPQGVIDATHKGLEITKTVADESVDFLKSKTGPAGEAIGATYTMSTKILGKMSETNAKYNAGTSDNDDYGKAFVEGAKEGATSVIVDTISGKLNDKVTDSVLDSKLGKKAGDYVESKANQAKKKATRDFFSGKTNSLNPRVLDDAAETAAKGAKQNINYGIGRASKPGYDATMGQPVKDAVDWAVGGEAPAQTEDSDSPPPSGSESSEPSEP